MGAYEYSIERLLAERGIEPAYRRQGYGMYLSPLRTETTPSFKVDFNRNLWYDFGIGEGGGPVDLCMRLDHCAVSAVISKLSEGNFKRRVVPSKPAVKVLSEGLLSSDMLIDYLKSRGISMQVAKAYCSELRIEVGMKHHIAIGFRNDEGGWEMRNGYLKISTSPKTVTTYKGAVDQCHLFEGFMDFLSFVSLGGGKLGGSYVVLNSVSNLRHCHNFLKGFNEIFCWLDNDRAGREALSDVSRIATGSMITDCTRYYRFNKDLNDFLTGKQVEGVKESPEKINKLKL